jgi:hypothetical protein
LRHIILIIKMRPADMSLSTPTTVHHKYFFAPPPPSSSLLFEEETGGGDSVLPSIGAVTSSPPPSSDVSLNPKQASPQPPNNPSSSLITISLLNQITQVQKIKENSLSASLNSTVRILTIAADRLLLSNDDSPPLGLKSRRSSESSTRSPSKGDSGCTTPTTTTTTTTHHPTGQYHCQTLNDVKAVLRSPLAASPSIPVSARRGSNSSVPSQSPRMRNTKLTPKGTTNRNKTASLSSASSPTSPRTTVAGTIITTTPPPG